MYRKVLIAGVTTAAIVGAGGTALALSGSDQPTAGTPTAAAPTTAAQSTAGKQAQQGKHDRQGLNGKRVGRMLRNLAHGQFVVKGKDGKFETHDVILGTVTGVSPTSITVQAADKKSETFSVSKDTKIRVRQNGKGAAGTIAQVAKGDKALVAGTGTSTLAAQHIFDVKPK